MKKLLIALLCSFAIQAQTFNFQCDEWSMNNIEPVFQQYINQFFDDAEERGIVLSEEEKTGTMTFNSPTGSHANGGSIESCRIGFNIFINPRYWDIIYNHEILHPFAKRLVYHELGHAVLELSHVCITEYDEENDCNKVQANIMNACNEDVCPIRNNESELNPEVFAASIDRMFASTDFLSCSSK